MRDYKATISKLLVMTPRLKSLSANFTNYHFIINGVALPRGMFHDFTFSFTFMTAKEMESFGSQNKQAQTFLMAAELKKEDLFRVVEWLLLEHQQYIQKISKSSELSLTENTHVQVSRLDYVSK